MWNRQRQAEQAREILKVAEDEADLVLGLKEDEARKQATSFVP